MLNITNYPKYKCYIPCSGKVALGKWKEQNYHLGTLLQKSTNIAIKNGEIANDYTLVTVDCDSCESVQLMQELIKDDRTHITFSWQGRPQRQSFLYRLPTSVDSHLFCNRSFSNGMELRINGYSLLPPSIHPLTRQPYLLIHDQSIAKLPLKILTIWQDNLISKSRKQNYLDFSYNIFDNKDKVQQLLAQIPLGLVSDYQVWIKIGMALFNSGYHFYLWDEWSRQAENYDPEQTTYQWNYWQQRGLYKGITLGTLYFYAHKPTK
jgi:hypothetical protein